MIVIIVLFLLNSYKLKYNKEILHKSVKYLFYNSFIFHKLSMKLKCFKWNWLMFLYCLKNFCVDTF